MSVVKLIIAKEFNERVRKKSFIISTLVAPLFFAFIMVIPALLASYAQVEDSEWKIAVIDQTNVISPSLKSSTTLVFTPLNTSIEEAKALVKDHETYQALLLISPTSEFSLYIKEQPSIQVSDLINRSVNDVVRENKIKSYNIENINSVISDINTKINIKNYKLTEEGESKVSNAAPLVMGIAFSIMIYMFILMYGNQVAMSVISEKSSRVIELIVSQVKPFWLMMGKIIGIGSVGLLQFIIWIVLSLLISTIVKAVLIPDIDISQIGSSATAIQQTGMSDATLTALSQIANPWYLIKILGCFIIYFIGGYMLYGALFAALGSAVDNAQEIGQFTAPITMPLILSVVMISFVTQTPGSIISSVMSYIPLTSPVIMMARIPSETVTWYEFAISVSILFSSIALTTYAAAKIFRIGIFMYGKKVSWKEIIKWIRYN